MAQQSCKPNLPCCSFCFLPVVIWAFYVLVFIPEPPTLTYSKVPQDLEVTKFPINILRSWLKVNAIAAPRVIACDCRVSVGHLTYSKHSLLPSSLSKYVLPSQYLTGMHSGFATNCGTLKPASRAEVLFFSTCP